MKDKQQEFLDDVEELSKYYNCKIIPERDDLKDLSFEDRIKLLGKEYRNHITNRTELEKLREEAEDKYYSSLFNINRNLKRNII